MSPSDWNDVHDTPSAGGANFYGVVEVVPEPSTPMLRLFGLGVAVRRR